MNYVKTASLTKQLWHKTSDEYDLEDAQREAEQMSKEELEKKLDEIEKDYWLLVAKGRAAGWDVAADNLEHFLQGTGKPRQISATWLNNQEGIMDERIDILSEIKELCRESAGNLFQGVDTIKYSGYRQVTSTPVIDELFYASGNSKLSANGEIKIQKNGNIVNIEGTISFKWYDKYDWHHGLDALMPTFRPKKDRDALWLQLYRGAKSYDMTSEFQRKLKGQIIIRRFWKDDVNLWWE